MKTKKTDTKTDNAEVVNSPRKTQADLKAEAFVHLLEENEYNQSKAYRLLKNRPDMNTTVASSNGNRMLKSQKVQALLAGTSKKASKALDVMVSDNKSYNHFQAVKLALAYEHGTPVSKSENVNVNLTLEDILLG